MRESVENTTHTHAHTEVLTDRQHRFAWLCEEVKGPSAGTPASPANDRCPIPYAEPWNQCVLGNKEAWLRFSSQIAVQRNFPGQQISLRRTQKGGQVVSHQKASPVTFSPGSRLLVRLGEKDTSWLQTENFFFEMQMYLLSWLGIFF